MQLTREALNDTKATINKFNTRAEQIYKKYGPDSPEYRQYEDLFKKIGGDEYTTQGKAGNLRLSTSKGFIQSRMDEKDIESILKMDKKYITTGAIEREMKEKLEAETGKKATKSQVEKAVKSKALNNLIRDYYALIYEDESIMKMLHKSNKNYHDLSRIVSKINQKLNRR